MRKELAIPQIRDLVHLYSYIPECCEVPRRGKHLSSNHPMLLKLLLSPEAVGTVVIQARISSFLSLISCKKTSKSTYRSLKQMDYGDHQQIPALVERLMTIDLYSRVIPGLLALAALAEMATEQTREAGELTILVRFRETDFQAEARLGRTPRLMRFLLSEHKRLIPII